MQVGQYSSGCCSTTCGLHAVLLTHDGQICGGREHAKEHSITV